MTYKTITKTLILATALSACSSTPEKPVAPQTVEIVNDFPTPDRVEYVFECIAKNGGLKFETQHACTCMIDKIAEKMRYKEYAEARTFTFLRSTPGEKGAVFRDPKQSRILRNKLKEAEQYAKSQCFVD